MNNELDEVLEAMRQQYYDEHKPANLTEADLLDRVICAMWRMIRYEHVETAVLTLEQSLQNDEVDKKYDENLTEPHRIGMAFMRLAKDEAVLDKLDRYQNRALRTYERTSTSCASCKRNAEPPTRPFSIRPSASASSRPPSSSPVRPPPKSRPTSRPNS